MENGKIIGRPFIFGKWIRLFNRFIFHFQTIFQLRTARNGFRRQVGFIWIHFLSPGKNGDSPLVINSDFWESHFLSGEKKTGAGFQPWPGLAQAGLSGEKTGAPDRARSGTRAGPASPAQNHNKSRKPKENKGFWEMLKSCSPQKYPETLKALRKMMYSGKSRIHCGVILRKTPNNTNGDLGILRFTDFVVATEIPKTLWKP